MPNPDNDRVEVYEDDAGEYRWRRLDSANGKIVSTSGEGYVSIGYAVAAAQTYNPGLPLRIAEEYG